MCITTNIDYIAEVAVGVVIVVALLFLLVVGEALAPKHPFLVKQATTLVEIFCWSWRKNQHTGIRGQVFAESRKVNQAVAEPP